MCRSRRPFVFARWRLFLFGVSEAVEKVIEQADAVVLVGLSLSQKRWFTVRVVMHFVKLEVIPVRERVRSDVIEVAFLDCQSFCRPGDASS